MCSKSLGNSLVGEVSEAGGYYILALIHSKCSELNKNVEYCFYFIALWSWIFNECDKNKVLEQVAHLNTTWRYTIRYWATKWPVYQAYNYK